MPVKAVIFDLDGTLVDTVKDITDALNYALGPFGRGGLTEGEAASLVGEGITRLIEKALGPQLVVHRDKAVELFLGYYSRHLVEHSRPYPGVPETLGRLGGFKKGVVSNKREDLSRRLLEELSLIGHFEVVAGSDTAGEKKPSAAPVRYVLERLGVSPDEAVIVGDSPLDIEAGKRAGLKTIGVAYGYKGRGALKEARADYVIEEIGGLLPLLYGSEDMLERRRDERYPVPEVSRDYIEMAVGLRGEHVSASLLDFSRGGIRFKSLIPIDSGETLECVISVPQSLTHSVRFKARVKHCIGMDVANYVVGAEIVDVIDKVWFRVFEKIYEFIMERKGRVF